MACLGPSQPIMDLSLLLSIFEAFCKNNGICHKRSAPYHPSTNGEAERFVQSFKTGLRTGTGDLQITLCKFLMRYQSSPRTQALVKHQQN